MIDDVKLLEILMLVKPKTSDEWKTAMTEILYVAIDKFVLGQIDSKIKDLISHLLCHDEINVESVLEKVKIYVEDSPVRLFVEEAAGKIVKA